MPCLSCDNVEVLRGSLYQENSRLTSGPTEKEGGKNMFLKNNVISVQLQLFMAQLVLQ